MACVAVLTGCAAQDTPGTSSVGALLTTASVITAEPPAQSPASSTTTTSRAADTPVDPKTFERAGMSVFTYIVGSRTGTCAISPHGATCQGLTPPDAPMVTAVPLPPRQADSVYIGEDSMHYTVFEGVGPSQGTLHPGESITVRENRCRYPDGETLQCTSGGDSFTVTSDGKITPSGTLVDPPVWTLPDEY